MNKQILRSLSTALAAASIQGCATPIAQQQDLPSYVAKLEQRVAELEQRQERNEYATVGLNRRVSALQTKLIEPIFNPPSNNQPREVYDEPVRTQFGSEPEPRQFDAKSGPKRKAGSQR